MTFILVSLTGLIVLTLIIGFCLFVMIKDTRRQLSFKHKRKNFKISNPRINKEKQDINAVGSSCQQDNVDNNEPQSDIPSCVTLIKRKNSLAKVDTQ